VPFFLHRFWAVRLRRRKTGNHHQTMTKNTTKLLDSQQLVSALNAALSAGFTERSIAAKRHARQIPFVKIGYRTIRYDFDKVLAALTRNEVKAIGT
jgi:hypothetical protein